VEVMLAMHDEYTPIPRSLTQFSLTTVDALPALPMHRHHAFAQSADHGGFKYNPPNGGPADKDVTGWVEARANEFLKKCSPGVKRTPYEKALRAQ